MIGITLNFNEEIIDRLKKHGLNVDYMGSALLILFALYEKKYKLLDKFDDSNKERRAIILYRQLERREMLSSSTGDYLYTITPKGASIVEYIKGQYKEEVVTEDLVEKSEDLEWVKSYIELFPKHLRDNSKDVENRMSQFLLAHPYSKDTILAATGWYLQNQVNENAEQYIMRSIYLIYKGAGANKFSRLASECENYIEFRKKQATDYDTSHMDIV